MTTRWIAESPAYWDADKRRIVGGAAPGIFDTRYQRLSEGDVVPGEWWRVERGGRVVGYGWLDVNWGDAEILLATDPEARGEGVGSYVLEQLEQEAHARGLNYMYNLVRPTHPTADTVVRWLEGRGFEGGADGRHQRRVRHSQL